MTRHRALLFFGVLSVLATQVYGIEQRVQDPGLVYVRAAVTTKDGRFVTGLLPQQFKVLEDDTLQAISFISGDEARSVALIFDGSFEWRNQSRALASAAFAPGRVSNDDILVLESADLAPNEATWQALNQLQQIARNTVRAVILFTDRRDPGGYSFSRVKDFLRETDIQFYVVGSVNSGTAANAEVLRGLTELSGGKAYFLSTPNSLERVAALVEKELRYQYVIGYRSTNPAKDGKWRNVKISADLLDTKTGTLNKFDVRNTPGYYAKK